MTTKRAIAPKSLEGAVAASPQLPPAANAPRMSVPISMERLFAFTNLIGLGFLAPLVKLCRGEHPQAQLRELW